VGSPSLRKPTRSQLLGSKKALQGKTRTLVSMRGTRVRHIASYGTTSSRGRAQTRGMLWPRGTSSRAALHKMHVDCMGTREFGTTDAGSTGCADRVRAVGLTFRAGGAGQRHRLCGRGTRQPLRLELRLEPAHLPPSLILHADFSPRDFENSHHCS
jgi:hypothetical protein